MARRRMEISAFDPGAGPTGFDGFGIVGLFEAEAAHDWRAQKTQGILTCAPGPLKTTRRRQRSPRALGQGVFLERCGGLCYTNDTFHLLRGEVMATGRDKDRKTRKKHRKNVKRMKALAKARRGSRKGKKG